MASAPPQQPDQREDEDSLGQHERGLHRGGMDRDRRHRPEEPLRGRRIDRRQLPVVHPGPRFGQDGGKLREFGSVGGVAVGIAAGGGNPPLPDHPVQIGLRARRDRDQEGAAEQSGGHHDHQHRPWGRPQFASAQQRQPEEQQGAHQRAVDPHLPPETPTLREHRREQPGEDDLAHA